MSTRSDGVGCNYKEMIRFNASATPYMSMDCSPKPPTAGCAIVMTSGKFLIILNFGNNTRHDGCRIECLGINDINGAMHFNAGHQKASYPCNTSNGDSLKV